MVPVVERFGYKATPNERFRDVETGGLREVDISAIGGVRLGKRGWNFVFPFLLVAVKALRCPLVFFTQDEIRMGLFLGSVQMSGLPQEVIDGRGRVVRLAEFLEFDDFHHYYRTGRVASQFCAVYQSRKQAQGRPKKQTGQMAQPLYEAGHMVEGRIDLFSDFEGLAKAVEAEKLEHAKSYCPDLREDRVNLQVYYPIFVTMGPLVECFVGSRRPRWRKVHRAGFLLRHSMGGERREFRIDVVDEAGLKPLLEVIEKDTEGLTKRLWQKRGVVSKSVTHFAKKLRRQSAKARCAYVRGDLPEH